MTIRGEDKEKKLLFLFIFHKKLVTDENNI